MLLLCSEDEVSCFIFFSSENRFIFLIFRDINVSWYGIMRISLSTALVQTSKKQSLGTMFRIVSVLDLWYMHLKFKNQGSKKFQDQDIRRYKPPEIPAPAKVARKLTPLFESIPLF